MKDELDQIRSKEAELQKQLEELRAKRVALEKGARASPAERGRPLRDLVLEMLQDAATPLNSLLLASVLRPLFGREVPSTRFGTLSNDEAKSYDSSRARPVYLCHCLTHDKGQAVKRFWARSDWPLAERVIGPMTGRVHFLEGAAWTINLARLVDADELAAEKPDVLQYVAADQARDAGLVVKRGDFPYEDWLGAIAAALERHTAEDLALRQAAAADLASRLTERELLFGARGGLVSLPGSTPSWRSAIDER
ncbi:MULTISPECIES: hypothetical protein [unclassified Mesorhizobium]|uniref:hypothetical protein n=1 Tax=unclassified Mesorhizobium TaxID=325217 RepID=UPI000FD2C126|nr:MULTISPECIES: hypothetical protein [unclassified Mesorhizobium]RUV90716.1 hypothetical protein EOA88_12090 [Mesorhizobium sp. M5C.F.Ca.IN.020.14.1.1]RUV30113.1 hypothetical protein EOA86_12555 [Mesorhizobium sp. M5C.F.Ca.IN.020.32.2.1]RWG47333.1 MAG: hypothetical protein EOQ62_12400 [Mesorhizobium sp.]RWH51908.1 MAG: hypothetical protein EOQ82_28495 [Mesorhizobium sp.]RWI67818.1 MAG: hypothetical protein EOR18_23030 [Mesorhizobium sp.]